MKAWLKVLGVSACVSILVGCELPSSDTEEDQVSSAASDRAIVDAIFHASMSWNNQRSKDKRTTQVNIPVNSRVAGPAGGYLNVVGSATGNMSYNDTTGYITGGLISLGFTITFTDYAMTINGQRFVVNGAPYMSVTGTFTIAPGGRSFGTASSIRIGGAYRVDGPGGSRTVNINLTIIVDSDGGGGHVSGTVGGVSVDYTF